MARTESSTHDADAPDRRWRRGVRSLPHRAELRDEILGWNASPFRRIDSKDSRRGAAGYRKGPNVRSNGASELEGLPLQTIKAKSANLADQAEAIVI